MGSLTESIILNNQFDIEILENFTYSQLRHHTQDLVGIIDELEKLKKMAVLCGEDVKAVEYQKYIYNATTNRNTMLVVMLSKEGDSCEHTSIETIWLN